MRLDGLTILIVDDEQLIRENLADYFQDLGARTFAARSGEEALEVLMREDVQVCTVDMRLPGMTGNEFILKAHELRPQLRFLVYTGTSVYEIPKALRAIGITRDFVIKKPVQDLNLFTEALSRLLGLDGQ
jgi:CheY-like chemotaxis protein